MNLVWERYPWLLQEDDANAEADRQRRWELHAAATQACAAVWLSGLRRLAEGQSKVSCPYKQTPNKLKPIGQGRNNGWKVTEDREEMEAAGCLQA